jgi:hypothetical protein
MISTPINKDFILCSPLGTGQDSQFFAPMSNVPHALRTRLPLQWFPCPMPVGGE